MIKSIYEKFTGNIIFDGKRLNIFSQRLGTQQGHLSLHELNIIKKGRKEGRKVGREEKKEGRKNG